MMSNTDYDHTWMRLQQALNSNSLNKEALQAIIEHSNCPYLNKLFVEKTATGPLSSSTIHKKQ